MATSVNAVKDPDVLKRELQGWYAFDFANSAFFQSAATVFIPLLLDGLATKYAWSRTAGERPQSCVDLKDDGLPETNCLKCVEGHGDRLITIDPVTGVYSESNPRALTLPGGINPTSFFFTMVSISVLFQAIAFISVGALGDYGNYRRRGLVLASTVGALATCAYIIVPVSASLYWFGGVLIIVANISLGISVVFYNSYLPLMVDDSQEVQDCVAAEATALAGKDEMRAAQEKVSSEYSSKGLMWGYIGGTSCLVLTFILITVLSFAGVSAHWTLGIGSMLSGVWWLGFSFWAFARLPERPGPPVPPGMNLLTVGWVRTYELLRRIAQDSPSTGYFLVLFFFFSDGYTTIATVSVLFASRELCLGLVSLVAMAIIVPLFAAVGGYVWFRLQMYSKWSTKSVLVLTLVLLAFLPLWGCIGFFSSNIGLRSATEMYVLAVWFGMCLGSAQAYGRALFSELTPEGHEADMFALFEITDKGSSWLGPLVASIIIQQTGKIRPVLIYLLCAMVLPALLLHRLDLSGAIASARHKGGADAALVGEAGGNAEETEGDNPRRQ